MGSKKKNNGRNGGSTTVPRTSQVLDFSKFSDRRLIKYAVGVDIVSGTAVVHGISNSGEVALLVHPTIPGVEVLVESFNSVRLKSIQVWFDNRGVTGPAASVARAGVFLLNGVPSLYDGSKLSSSPAWAGRGLNAIVPSKPITLRVGPEFASGLFGQPAFSSSKDSIVISTLGYSGSVRLVFLVEVLGPPELLTVSPP
jgi:hypothetical protein